LVCHAGLRALGADADVIVGGQEDWTATKFTSSDGPLKVYSATHVAGANGPPDSSNSLIEVIVSEPIGVSIKTGVCENSESGKKSPHPFPAVSSPLMYADVAT